MKRSELLRCVLSLLAGSLAVAAFAGELQVELRPEVVVHRAQVHLGDVAYVRGSELESVRRLMRLPLGRAPAASADVRLTRDTLARWARTQLGGIASSADWTGADEVVIASAPSNAPEPTEPQAASNGAVVVARGEWVTLLSRNGGIELESPAEALQDARVGHPVRVRWPGAPGSVVARVVARGRVEIIP